MPFYEYECQACKYYAEVMQKISDAPLIKCPSCGKKALKKLVSAPVFRLKGGGWYETDFKSEKESKRNLLGADKEETKPAAAEAKEGKAAKPAESGTAKTVGPTSRSRAAKARSAGSRRPSRPTRGRSTRKKRR